MADISMTVFYFKYIASWIMFYSCYQNKNYPASLPNLNPLLDIILPLGNRYMNNGQFIVHKLIERTFKHSLESG